MFFGQNVWLFDFIKPTFPKKIAIAQQPRNSRPYLVGGWTNPFQKYSSNWIISQIFGVKIKTCLKPPPSYEGLMKTHWFPLRPKPWNPDFWWGVTSAGRGVKVDSPYFFEILPCGQLPNATLGWVHHWQHKRKRMHLGWLDWVILLSSHFYHRLTPLKHERLVHPKNQPSCLRKIIWTKTNPPLFSVPC